MTWFWGAAAAAALLWPDHLGGPFDGVPLDRVAEALVVAAVFPLLWLLAPEFLRARAARTGIALLLAWRIASALLLVQDGWCVRFIPARPYAKDAAGAPHAWDVRADWRAPDPRCSAIVARPYRDMREFPAWFFNLPPNNDSWPDELDRPPEATVAMTVYGFLRAPSAGRLRIDQNPNAPTQILIDERPANGDEQIPAGIHTVAVRTTLKGSQWRLVPTWNGDDLWTMHLATVDKPSRVDVFARRWLVWVPSLLVAALIAAWALTALWRVGTLTMWIWTASASAALIVLVAIDRADLGRQAVALLAGAAIVPVPQRWRTWRGAALLMGVPWMAFVVACAASAIGRFVLYESGNDFWMFQRFAYRIVMQGYWLEGGSPTFWFQPLYRWIAGALHVVFGDSSAGEWYWDGACLLAGAMFAWRVVSPLGGFGWGLVASALALATFTCGTAQYLLGRGLGEVSSAGLVYAAALLAIRSRGGNWRAAIAAGVCATLAFYTRLNNLPMAAGTALFAVPWPIVGKRLREPLIVLATLGAGILAFAWRTWHYTGVFSVFYGTQRDLLAIWQPGMPIATVLSRIAGSVMMVLTVNDPARFDWYALPVLAGAVIAVLAALRVGRLRQVPARLVLFFFASIAGAFVARGSAYAGRFSVHAIPVTSALVVCGAVCVLGQTRHA